MSEPDEVGNLRRRLGRQLAACRKALGYNQTDFAPLTGYARSTVANVEVGRQHVPREFWERCEAALGISGILVAQYDDIVRLVRQQREREAQDAQTARTAKLRAWLNETTIAAASVGATGPESSVTSAVALSGLDLDELQHVAAALEDARRYFDGSVVSYFGRQLEACKAEDGNLGPRRTLPAVLGVLGAIAEHAREVRSEVRRELLSVGANGAEFAGWLYRDIHQPVAAAYWHDRAMEWAQEVGDLPMQGYVLLRKSQMAYDDRQAARVLTLAQAAQNGPWQLPPKVRAEVTQQEARGMAMIGEPLAAIEQKLDDARQLLEAAEAADEQPDELGAYYDEGVLMLRTASCYVEAGQPGRAAALFGEVLEKDSLSRRDRGYFLARHAASLALSGEPDDAATTGLQSIQLLAVTDSARTKQELKRTLTTLQPWINRPAPRALRDALPV